MVNNSIVFAESMKKSYEKQKEFVESVKAFDIRYRFPVRVAVVHIKNRGSMWHRTITRSVT